MITICLFWLIFVVVWENLKIQEDLKYFRCELLLIGRWIVYRIKYENLLEVLIFEERLRNKKGCQHHWPGTTIKTNWSWCDTPWQNGISFKLLLSKIPWWIAQCRISSLWLSETRILSCRTRCTSAGSFGRYQAACRFRWYYTCLLRLLSVRY